MNLLDTFTCDLSSSLLTHWETSQLEQDDAHDTTYESSQLSSVKLQLALHLHDSHLGGVTAVVRKHHARIRVGDLSFPLSLRQWRRAAVVATSTGITAGVGAVAGAWEEGGEEEEEMVQAFMDWELGNNYQPAYEEGPCCVLTRMSAMDNQGAFDHDKIPGWLVEGSSSWPLPIQSVLIRDDRCIVALERSAATRSVLQQIQESGTSYGRLPPSGGGATVRLTADVNPNLNESTMDLSSLRLILLKMHLQRLLEASGYQVVLDEEETTPLHLYLTTRSSSVPNGAVQLLAGVVTSKEQHCKEVMSSREYYGLRLEDMEAAARHKTGDLEDWGSCLSSLADAAVKVDLLGVRLGGHLVLDVRGQQRPGRAAGTKGAAFIMYNFARVAAILARFDQMVASGSCPPLPLLAEVDLSVLNKEEEWELVFDYLLPFPHLVRSCTQGAAQGKVLTHSICQFLTAFGSAISSYYSKIRILVEPRSHLLPALFARIHLLKAVRQVLANALQLLDVSAVRHM